MRTTTAVSRGVLLMALCPALASAASVTLQAQRAPVQETVQLAGLVTPKESEEIKAGWYSMVRRIAVRPGQKVKKGDLIAETETTYFEQQISQLKMQRSLMVPFLQAAVSDLAAAEKELARKRGLVAQKLAPDSEAVTAESNLIDARNGLAARKKALVEVDSLVDELQGRLRSSNLHAGIDGVVTHLIVPPEQLRGAFLAEAGTTLVRVDKPGTYNLRAAAIDVQVRKLKVGQKAELILSGFAEPFPAIITSITNGNQVKSSSSVSMFGAQPQPDPMAKSLYTVVFEFKHDKSLLRRELRGKASVAIGEARTALTVPWSAVQSSSAGASVRVPDAEKGWKLVPVKLGQSTRHRVEILSGLAEGQPVEAKLW